jgi:hypothetical protein
VNPIPYRPALFIGLGGTGKEVLLRLRRRFYERFRTTDVPFARFLWVDTDTRAVDARGEKLDEAFSAVSFGPTETVSLLKNTVGTDMADIFDNPEKNAYIHKWLYEEVERFGRAIGDGAGGVRAIGRLTLFAGYDRLRQAVETSFQQLAENRTIERTTKFFEGMGLPLVNTAVAVDPIVFVVASLAGGTGCGTFLDTGFMLCETLKRLRGSDEHDGFFSYLFMPNVYYSSPSAGELAKRSFGNAYAALKELDHFTKRISTPGVAGGHDVSIDFHVQWRRNQEMNIKGPPYNAVYLLETTNEAGVSIGSDHRKDLFSMLAECLFLDLLPGAFADAKRSDYSNIVAILAGPEGANNVAGGVILTQMFSRRYASCGLSKIEIPVDSVRGACGAGLAADILGYIVRDSEDASVAKSVRDNLAGYKLDADGIPSLYTGEWKDQIHTGVAEFFRSVVVRSQVDVDGLKLGLEKLTESLSGPSGDVARWFRKRTGTVAEQARTAAATLLREQCLENEERGLMATIRKGGFLELAQDQVRAMHSPDQAGSQAVFDRRKSLAEEDAKILRGDRDRYLAELDAAIGSIPILILHARHETTRILMNRIRDCAEQAILARAEAVLIEECKKVALELDKALVEWRARLGNLADKFAGAHAASNTRREEFMQSLDTGAHLLFTRYFSMATDWPLFYKLGVDPDTNRPSEVNPAQEYGRLLRAWNAPNGVLDLAALFERESEDEVGRRMQKYCEDLFAKDMNQHERPVSLYDRPVFKDPVSRRSVLVDLVRRARPLLRQGATTEKPRFAYLGLYTHNPRTPEEQGIIDEIRDLVRAHAGSSYLLDIQPLEKPYEMYLYFSNYAFSAPSLPVVFNECHEAYTDFYTEMLNVPSGAPQSSIPLHASKLWEGKFDDLQTYNDSQAKVLVEVLSILLFGTMLKVVRPRVEKTQLVYEYMLGAPLNRPNTIGNRRLFISRLTRENDTRLMFLQAISERETALTKEQAVAYTWALTASLSDPEMLPALPEYKLLSDKLNTIYDLAIAKGADPIAVDSSLFDLANRFELIKANAGLGLEWPVANQPVVKNIDLWVKKR